MLTTLDICHHMVSMRRHRGETRGAQVAQPFRGMLGPRLLEEDEQPIEHRDDKHRDTSWGRPAMNARTTAAENSSATR